MNKIDRGDERPVSEKVFLDNVRQRDSRGLFAKRPAPNKVKIGDTYWAIDTDIVYVSDGNSWREV